ncbi:MAG: CoA pyrophosphatase [Anaerolineales bacterium]|jgi:8-oxo-dGTP pyrophosphatase MutT (NUDIX family)|nr:CoA pyrophosphatase [Anaerolineales bacterium]
MMAEFSIKLSENKISELLSLNPNIKGDTISLVSDLEAPKPAAVLVPLIYNPPGAKTPGWHILYTRRTESVHDHKGQVSFPGGRADPGDDYPTGTALREAYEEIGLRPSDVHVLGQMNPFQTITNYLVTPVIGVIPWPYPFTLQPQEVSRVFTIPMDWMAKPDNYEIKQREFPPSAQIPPQFRNIQVIYYRQYDGELLWGITAEVTLRLLRLLELVN